MSYYHLRIHQAFDFDGGTGVSNGHPPPLRWAPIVMVSRECLRVLRNIREFPIGTFQWYIFGIFWYILVLNPRRVNSQNSTKTLNYSKK